MLKASQELPAGCDAVGVAAEAATGFATSEMETATDAASQREQRITSCSFRFTGNLKVSREKFESGLAQASNIWALTPLIPEAVLLNPSGGNAEKIVFV